MYRSHVLVVEDDDSIRQAVSELLRDEGCVVTPVRGGAEALRALERLVPDVILLDYRMPDLDGAQFSERYRATDGEHAPVVLVTAAHRAEELAAAAGADAVLEKPFDLDHLLDTLRPYLDCIQPK